MSMLDGLLGGIVGTEMASVVSSIIARHGGMQGLVDQFERSGLGATVQSWVGSGANQPISADQLRQAISPAMIGELAAKAGLSGPDLAGKLAALLPQAVDALTPHGRVS